MEDDRHSFGLLTSCVVPAMGLVIRWRSTACLVGAQRGSVKKIYRPVYLDFWDFFLPFFFFASDLNLERSPFP